MVLAVVLASCGKDNKVGGTGTHFSPITTNVQGAADLGQKIETYGTSFGTGQLYYYGTTQTWANLANTGLNLGYRYTKSSGSVTSPGSSCDKKWGIFYVCSYSSSSTSSNYTSAAESRKVNNNTVDITTKANELKAIINRANPLIPIQSSGYSYLIQTTDGFQYVIDTRYPLQANPIGIRTSTYTEYLYNITEN